MSNTDDPTDDMTIPVDALTDAFESTDSYCGLEDLLHAWAEGSANGSGPSSTHVFRDKPMQPLPPPMLAMLKEWGINDQEDLVERELLGEGGMAVVYLADQSLPRRQVAVKRLRDNTIEQAQQLFAEALLTGALEHPNIIPVHAIRIDPELGPEVVLKRVEGVSLSEAYESDGQTDAGLRRLLPKLLQVCNALEYAHARHIIHRDIKAENIMLGQYGEVYLLDWGIAIDQSAPLAASRGTVGTPHYIAPEMISGDPSHVDVRTDVYLLGATLHYLLVGKPRHDAPTSLSAALLASQSEPFDYPSSVFSELGALANRACALDSNDRPQTVAEFRLAIEDCLTHWDAMRTVKLAQNDYEAVVGEAAKSAPLTVTAKHFDAAVLRLQSALASWQGCTEAALQLRRLRIEMAKHHLDVGDAKAARLLLSQVDTNSNTENEEVIELMSAIDRASDRESQVYRKAAASDISLSRGGRQRASLAMLVVVTITCAVAVYQQFGQTKVRTASEGLMIWLAGAVLVMSALALNRKSIMKNEAGRRAMLIIMLAPVLVALIRLTVFINDLDPSLIHPIETFAIAHICATSVEVFPKGPYFALFAAVLGICGLIFQPFAYVAFVTALLVGCAGFVWQWLLKTPSTQE